MNKHVALALTQVVDRIEPLTRFDKTSLKQESGNVRVATGRAFWRFNAVISNEREEHTDRLPHRATRIDSSGQLDEVAQQTVRSANDALPHRIQTWLQSNAGTDRKLTSSDCFDGPKVFGHEYKHSDCGGDGWVKCGGCTNGYNDCNPCDKTGRVSCSNCRSLLWGNSGKEKCRGCRGSRKKDGHTCPSCNGRGEVTCGVCHGAKTLVCSKCAGAGRLRHSACDATGRLTCGPCKGTGYFHILRTVACTVHDHFRVDLKDAKSEVVGRLIKRDLVGLRSLASVTQKPPTVQVNIVEREYQFECVITEIGLHVAEKKLELIGFGGKAQIFDFKGIVPTLLAADLTMLEQAVAKTPLRLWGSPTELLEATSQFLDSPVNIRIDDPELLSDRIVDRTYVQRVKALLPAALGRITSANLGLAFLLTALATAVVFLICHFAGAREISGNWMFIAPILAAVTAWVLLERRTHQRLRTILNDQSGEKVDAPLRKYYILWKARGLALILTSILLGTLAVLPLS